MDTQSRSSEAQPAGRTQPAMRPKALAAVTLLIAYGSLYPFDFQSPSDLGLAFRNLLTDRSLWTSRGDVLGNVGLFVPLGVVGVWWVAGPAARRSAAMVTFVGGLVLAFALQVAQIWIASRSAVLADIAWNGLGLLLGIGAGIALASERFARRVGLQTTAPASTLGLLSLWLVAEMAPLVPTLDLGTIKASVKQLVLTPSVNPVEAVYLAAQVVFVSNLVSTAVGRHSSNEVLAALLGLVLVGKAFIVDLSLDWTTVVGFATGALAWYVWTTGARRAVPSGALFSVLLGAYTLNALEPFALRTPVPLSWVPFAASLDGSMLANLRALSAAAFVLGGCLWLMRDLGWHARRATLGLALWVLALEGAQMWIVGRAPDSTEPALALLAGWVLWRVEPGALDTSRSGQRQR